MKAALFRAPGKIEYAETEKPKVGPDDVLMRIRAVGICGTDLHIYRGGFRTPTNMSIGHEFSGEVAEVGKNVKNVRKGQRVVAEHVISCRACSYCKKGNPNLCMSSQILGADRMGALAEYMLVPGDLVYPIPKNLDFEQAALIEPLSIAVYVVREAGRKIHMLDKDVAVVGQGPIGLLIGAVAKLSGANVIGIDIMDSRLNFAQKNGFVDHVINSKSQDVKKEIHKITDDNVDVAFEVVGIQQAVDLCIDITKRNGDIYLVGIFQGPEKIHVEEIVKRELNLYGSYTCAFSFPTAISLAADKRIDLQKLITHTYPLKDVVKAFEESSVYADDRIKTVVTVD